MKPIFLEFEAFGPYLQIQQIDFLDFSNKTGGLFLIQGETGAGKTVLLDGITCALYGQSSGHTRGDFKQMRCQQALDTQITRVSFQFQQGQERYRFERSLKKKKKRNPDAPVDFNETFSACIWKKGYWEPLEENIKQKAMNEWAEKLIGLNYLQFCQVVLLPQGQFEKFLVSETKDKEQILQTLFDNEQWKRIAERLKEQVNQRYNLIKEKEQQIKMQLASYNCETILQLEQQIEQYQLELNFRIQQENQKDQEYKILKEQIEQARRLQEQFDKRIELEQQQQYLQQQQPLIEQQQQQLLKAKQADRVSTEIHLLEQANQTMKEAIAEYKSAKRQQEQLQQEWIYHQQQSVCTKEWQGQLEEAKKIEQEITNLKEKYQNVESLQQKIVLLDKQTKQWIGQLLFVNEKIQNQYQQLKQQIHLSQTKHQEILQQMLFVDQQQQQLETLINQYKQQQFTVEQKKQKLPLLQQWEQTQKTQQQLQIQENTLYQSLQQITITLKQLHLQKKQEKEKLLQSRQQLEQQIQQYQQQFFQQTAIQLAGTLKPNQPCPVCGSCQHPKQQIQSEKDRVTGDIKKSADKLQELQKQQQSLEKQIRELEKELLEQEMWLERLPSCEGNFLSEKEKSTVNFQQLQRSLSQWEEKKSQKLANQEQQQQLWRQLEQFEGISSQQLQTEIQQQETAYQEALEQKERLTQKRQSYEKDSNQLLQQLIRLQEKEQNLKQQASYLAQHADRWKGYSVAKQTPEDNYQTILEQVNRLLAEQNTLQETLNQSIKGLDSRWGSLQELEQALQYNQEQQQLLNQQIQKNMQAYDIAKEKYDQAQGRIQQAEKAGVRAREQHNIAKDKCDKAIQQAGFETIEQCKKSMCSLEQQQLLQQEIDQYQYRCQQILQELKILVEQLQDKIPPPIQQLQENMTHLEEDLKKIQEDLAIQRDLQNRRKISLKNMKQAQQDWNIQYQDWLKKNEFACLLKGEKGISLARYILAKQLEIVTQQANLQLQKVHGGRYQLYRDTKITLQQKAGLDLEVEDALSGQRRSVKGLSGGEKFLVSLALSLGLSSVVQAQKGGIQIDAMFIDEGFGTLDPSSISDALDMLLSVQNSGRIVGIISHVSALRETIPCGIYVKKNKKGSQITIL